MKVAVLGGHGMLGHMLVEKLKVSRHIGEVKVLTRKDFEVGLWRNAYKDIEKVLGYEYDYIINCIGAIKPMFSEVLNTPLNVKINSVFPWELANFGKDTDTKVIHITTDCVFNGRGGAYTEESPHNATDAYGKSKSLGEPTNCMVLRTSIIGPELAGRGRSLISWVRSNDGKEISGFTNHLWNGMTTLELSRCIIDIIRHDLYAEDLFHLYSNDVDKFELVSMIVDAFELDIVVNPKDAPSYCNRILRTNKKLNSILKPDQLSEQIKRLRYYV